MPFEWKKYLSNATKKFCIITDRDIPAEIERFLNSDYLWLSSAKIGAGKFRPLRPMQLA
jgi:hypothetical protein